ncbi:hypothetical protein [Aliarcobacter cibarius]|uniref:Uncharacterized protein n=1 Tax=Aliarcobacter cibarius TaxID=255507 RepID=A0ABY2V8S8_9BACT|nr:hypothetical protein [Aliarcobacter cibarius]TLS99929.1 hypothetical protein FE247_05200 [Aliarcobacter cibarius]TLT00338.1 hypothetical protein FE245_05630 [Aliarcobacter cibarius]
MEKIQGLWCIFKKEDGKELWLDRTKKWNTKFDKAGIKDMNTAMKVLNKFIKEEEQCTTKQLCLEI